MYNLQRPPQQRKRPTFVLTVLLATSLRAEGPAFPAAFLREPRDLSSRPEWAGFLLRSVCERRPTQRRDRGKAAASPRPTGQDYYSPLTANPSRRNNHPKTQVPTPNLGHPPSLYTSPRRAAVISSPRLKCQRISNFSIRATRQAAKDFESLQGAEKVYGSTKVKELAGGAKAVLYESKGSGPTLAVQDAAGRTVTKIRY